VTGVQTCALPICPDGVLRLLPFETLESSRGKYLLEDHQVSYTGNPAQEYAGTVLKTKVEAVVIADPQLNGSSETSRLTAQQLPGAKREGELIATELKETMRMPVHLYEGQKATADALFSIASPAVLHIAAHGIVPEEQPASGILLAGEKGGTIVTADDVRKLNLKGTRLVVLSGCRTGITKLSRGKPPAGLESAFLDAGAESVILSLWDVADVATEQLMTRFYSLWLTGSSKAEAFQNARLQMMLQYKHPYYWGGFILVGSRN